MASGFGVWTKRGRCYELWTDLSQCVDAHANDPRSCGPFFDDYYECLHHRKQARRAADCRLPLPVPVPLLRVGCCCCYPLVSPVPALRPL